MCGLVGGCGPSWRSFESRIGNAKLSIAHRGPDAQGQIVHEALRIVVGHRRLAILDLSPEAAQPMQRETSLLSYNGEIFNHLELRQSALSKIEFSSHSDTETLIYGLQLEGPRFLERLEGMFAGFFADSFSQKAWLFRDSLGIKPLYYSVLPDSSVVFSSEIKALLSLAKVEAEINPGAVASYLAFENYPQGDSFFSGVHLLRPGEVLELDLSETQGPLKISSKLFSYKPKLPTSKIDVESLLSKSVVSHLLSDVPVACYLSGGLDSSLVASFAAEQKFNLKSYVGYFEDVDSSLYDERPVARVMAKSVDFDLTEVPITPKDLIENFDKILFHLDEPRMGMGSFSQYVVARVVAKTHKVVLTGHGGDELFGGYPLFKAAWMVDRGLLSGHTLKSLSKLKLREIPWIVYFLKSVLGKRKAPFAPRIWPSSQASLVTSSQAPSKTQNFKAHFEGNLESSVLVQLEEYYREVYLPGLLVVEDKVSMACGLESRVPFWSQELASVIPEIPISERLLRGELKGLLREIAKRRLPAEVLKAPKRGFPTPLRLWFRNSALKDFLNQRLCVASSVLDAIIPLKDREGLLKQHRARPLPYALDEIRAHKIWTLLCVESWSRQFGVQSRGNA